MRPCGCPCRGRPAPKMCIRDRGYSDSPKAIADELLSRGWKVYWTVKGAVSYTHLDVYKRQGWWSSCLLCRLP